MGRSMITYEITAQVRDGLRERYEQYLRGQHIPDVLATGAFVHASFSASSPGRYRIRYEAPSREVLDAYLKDHAPRLRKHFADTFPEGIEVMREEWTVTNTWLDLTAAAAQGRFYGVQAERFLAGLTDVHRHLQPAPGAKTAGWIIGHLAVTGDFARKLAGRTPMCPREWRAMFNPGTTPSTDAATYPPMQELSEALRSVYADLGDAALAMDAATRTAVNPFEPVRAAYPTIGEFVAYMLSGHFAYHLGQLVEWRSAAGLGRVAPDSVSARMAAR